jgi:hypothetical protein
MNTGVSKKKGDMKATAFFSTLYFHEQVRIFISVETVGHAFGVFPHFTRQSYAHKFVRCRVTTFSSESAHRWQ